LKAANVDKKESNGLRDPITTKKYPKWRSLSLVSIPVNPGFEARTLQTNELSKRKRVNNEEGLIEQLGKLQVELGSSKTSRISLEEQLFTKEKLRKFMEKQIMEKEQRIVSLEMQLKGETIAKKQAKKEREELGASWVQTNAEFKTSRTNFDYCQENTYLFSKVQVELKSQIKQYELLYKKHVMLESELAEVTVKEDDANNSQTKEIDLIKRKFDKVKIRIKHLEESSTR